MKLIDFIKNTQKLECRLSPGEKRTVASNITGYVDHYLFSYVNWKDLTIPTYPLKDGESFSKFQERHPRETISKIIAFCKSFDLKYKIIKLQDLGRYSGGSTNLYLIRIKMRENSQ